MVQFIREIPCDHATSKKILVKRDGSYFVISSVITLDFGPFEGGLETYAFPATADGEITSGEVAGGSKQSVQDVLAKVNIGDWNEQ